MGACLQVVHTFKQNLTGGAFEALAAGSGDTLVIPEFVDGSRAWLLEAVGGDSAHTAEYDVRSPNFHDNIRGLRMAGQFNPTLSGADGDPQVLLPYYVRQPLYSADTLIAEVNATAADNAQLDLLCYFENIRGSDQALHYWGEIESRIVNTLGIEVSVVAGAAGDYGAARAITTDDNRLVAGREYALLGVTGQLPCGLVALMGPETSNRWIGCPIHWDVQKSAGWFVDLSVKYDLPLIPTFDGTNAAQWFIKAADPGGAISPLAHLILAELG